MAKDDYPRWEDDGDSWIWLMESKYQIINGVWKAWPAWYRDFLMRYAWNKHITKPERIPGVYYKGDENV